MKKLLILLLFIPSIVIGDSSSDFMAQIIQMLIKEDCYMTLAKKIIQ